MKLRKVEMILISLILVLLGVAVVLLYQRPNEQQHSTESATSAPVGEKAKPSEIKYEMPEERKKWFQEYAPGGVAFETMLVNKSVILDNHNRRIDYGMGIFTSLPHTIEEELGVKVYYDYEGDHFRSCSEQRRRYEAYARQHGYAAADKTLARPLHSEHQLGLAVDLRNAKGELLGSDPEDQKVIDWLEKNIRSYGYIIRYPKGKEHITGFPYKPYHIRFVGGEVASKMGENQTLEEYFGYIDLKNEYFYQYDHVSNYKHLDSVGCTLDQE